MKSLTLPTAAIFGVSLFGITVLKSPVTVAVSDVAIALLLIYSVLRFGRMAKSYLGYATVLLAIVILLSGAVNTWRNAEFDPVNFATNYIRIIGIVAMVLLLPSLLRSVGHERLVRSTLWVLRVHSVLILVDSVGLLSDALSPSNPILTRPAGLFLEPGWFGVYAGLSVFYIIQTQHNFGRQYLRLADITLVGVAIIASAGVRGVIFFGVFILLLVLSGGVRTRPKLVGGLSLMSLLLIAAVVLLPGVGPARGFDRLIDRAPALLPTQLTDDSGRERLIGSWRLARSILSDAPLLGTGLGGANAASTSLTFSERDPTTDPYFGGPIEASSSSMIVTILQVGGLLGVLAFFSILARMIVLPQTRLIGIGFLVLQPIWGGAFETFVWWHIALAISLIGASQKIPRELPQRWKFSRQGSASLADKSVT